LDVGDENLLALMSRLEQAVKGHLEEATPDRKKPEPVRARAIKAEGGSAHAVNELL
jgi:hypothetical protein